ncbi:hypothetical protein [Aurantiacibacter hainanensis]|uniref:hypothetical protein n=1 Tax=Aurantiacibacter hainanensis TaxID=3076114 RepID=UPI0030C6F789
MDRVPEGAVGSRPAQAISLLIGTLLVTISGLAIFLLIAIYGFFIFAGTVTLTGWIVFGAYAIPLGLGFANAVEIIRGAAWRVVPWVVWMIVIPIIATAIFWLAAPPSPAYIPDRDESVDQTVPEGRTAQ